jgi:hypothetical protein
MSERERAMIQAALQRYLANPTGAPAPYRGLARQHQLLPILPGWTGFVGLREDGELLWVSDDDGSVSVVLNVHEVHLAKVRGPELFPDLSFLRPVPAEDWVKCSSCSGSGVVLAGGQPMDGIRCRCAGLGRLPPGVASFLASEKRQPPSSGGPSGPRHPGPMTMRRVFIDPDGTDAAYLGVIMEYPTGVLFANQCGGVECLEREVEGYFVPLAGSSVLADRRLDPFALRAPFHRDDDCIYGGESRNKAANYTDLSGKRLEQLIALVAEIPYWQEGDDSDAVARVPLRLDETRLAEICEAWVPVLTPDGPGILIWPNCD